MLFIVTQSIHFVNPDNKYLDTDGDNIVCGVYKTKKEAKKRAMDIATSNLFYGCQNYIKEKENEVSISVPDYVNALFRIIEYFPT